MTLEEITDINMLNEYMKQEKYNKTMLLISGIATKDTNINFGRIDKSTIIPFWKRCYASDEVMDETTGIIANNKILPDKDIAVIHVRKFIYNINNLKSIFAGSDTIRNFIDYFTKRWNSLFQKILIFTLNGIFASESMVASSIEEPLSGNSIIDAQYLIGDAFGEVSGVMMHSAVMAKMKKLGLIQFDKESGDDCCMGQKTIVDDALEAIDGKYPIYFLGHGAISFNENIDEAKIEHGYNTPEVYDIVTSSRVFTMHPRGIKWAGNAMGVTPTKAELENGSNWKLIADRKNVAITRLMATL